MSVDTTNIKQQFTMDGATKNFTFSFATLPNEPTNIKCRRLNTVNTATYTTLTYDTDYTVAVNADGSGGVITVVDSSPTDYLFAYRETPDLQETDYSDYNQFPADTLEQDLDRRTLRSQEADDGVSRAVQFDVSSSISGISLPSPADRRALLWDGTGGTIINSTYDPDSSATICTSAQTIAMAAATAASISQIGAEAQRITAQTASYNAQTSATLAASSATVALIASSISSIHYVTTASYIATAYITGATITGLTVGTVSITNMDTVTIGSMTVTTDATIANLDAALATAGNLTVTTSMTSAMVDAAALTAGMLLVTTSATIANLAATALTASDIDITGGNATALTISNIEITGGIATALTVTTLQATNLTFDNLGDVTASNLTVLTNATIAEATIPALSAGTITGTLTGDVTGNLTGNASTSTVAANLYGTPDLPDGVTATTQGAGDNSTKLATTAYADNAGSQDTTLTVGSLTVTTDATIVNLAVTGLSAATISNCTTATITGLTATGLTATTLNLTGGYATSLSVGTLSNCTTATITSLTSTTITVGGNPILPNIQKSVAIEAPTTADSITLFKVPSACTIQAMYAVVEGTLPTAGWAVFHGTDRSSGTAVNTAGTTTADTTSGDTITTFTDGTIVANSWIWAVITSVSGTIDTLNITIDYKVD